MKDDFELETKPNTTYDPTTSNTPKEEIDDEITRSQEEAAEARVLGLTPREVPSSLERKQVITEDIASQFQAVKNEFGSYTDYYKNNNNKHFPGFEAQGATYLLNEARDREYLDFVETGIMTEEDFLRKHYIKDVLEDAGHNITNPHYWYQKIMSGDGTNPLNNKYTMHKAYEVARSLYNTDSLEAARRRAAANQLELSASTLFNSKITGEDFARLFQVPEGEDPATLLKSYQRLGYIATEAETAIEPLLRDETGKVYGYLHRSGVLYDVGDDNEKYRAVYDAEDGQLRHLRAQGDGAGGVIHTVADSLIAGVAGFVATLGQTVGAGVYGLASVPFNAANEEKHAMEGFKDAYQVIEAFKYGETFGQILSSDYVHMNDEWNALRIADGTASIIGTIVGMKVTFGASAALNATAKAGQAAAITGGSTAKAVAWGGAKHVSNVTMKMTGIYSGRWGGINPSHVLTPQGLSSVAAAKAGLAGKAQVATKVSAQTHLTMLRTASLKNHAALITTYGAKDFTDNVGYMLMRADIDKSYASLFGETENEQVSNIVKRGAGGAIFNMAISAAFTGGVDDSPSRRLTLFRGGGAKAMENPQAAAIVSRYVSGDKWRLFYDFGSDAIDNITTMTVNQALKQKGEANVRTFVDSLDPHTIGMGLYMAGITAKGSQRFSLQAAGATLSNSKASITKHLDDEIAGAKDPKKAANLAVIKQELHKTYQDVLGGKEVKFTDGTKMSAEDLKKDGNPNLEIHATVAFAKRAEEMFSSAQMESFIKKSLDDVRITTFRELDDITTRNLLAAERDLAEMTKGIFSGGGRQYFGEMLKNAASGGTRVSTQNMVRTIQETLKISNEDILSYVFGDISKGVKSLAADKDLGTYLDTDDTKRLTTGETGIRLKTDQSDGAIIAKTIQHLFPKFDATVEVQDGKSYIGFKSHNFQHISEVADRVRTMALIISSIQGATKDTNTSNVLAQLYETRFGELKVFEGQSNKAQAQNMRDLIKALVDGELITIDQAAELFGAAAAEGDNRNLFREKDLREMTVDDHTKDPAVKDLRLKELHEANEDLRLVDQFISKSEVTKDEINAAKALQAKLRDTEGSLTPEARYILDNSPTKIAQLDKLNNAIKMAALDPKVLPQLLDHIFKTSVASYSQDSEIDGFLRKTFTKIKDPKSILKKVEVNNNWAVNNVYIDLKEFLPKTLNELGRGYQTYKASNPGKTIDDYLKTDGIKGEQIATKYLVLQDMLKDEVDKQGTPYLVFTKREANDFARSMGYKSLSDMEKHSGVYSYASPPLAVTIKLTSETSQILTKSKAKITKVDAESHELSRQLTNGVYNLDGEDYINIDRVSDNVISAKSQTPEDVEMIGFRVERVPIKAAVTGGKSGETDTIYVKNSPRYNVDFEDANYFRGTQIFSMLEKMREGNSVHSFEDDKSFFKKVLEEQLGKEVSDKDIAAYFGADSPWDVIVGKDTVKFRFNLNKFDKLEKDFNSGKLKTTNIFKYLPTELTEQETREDYGNQSGFRIGNVDAIKASVTDFAKLLTNWYDVANQKVIGYKDTTIGNEQFVRGKDALKVFDKIKTSGVEINYLIEDLRANLDMNGKRNAYVQDTLNRLELALVEKSNVNGLTKEVNRLLGSQTVVDILLKYEVGDELHLDEIRDLVNKIPEESFAKEMLDDKNIINIEDKEYQAAAQIFRNIEGHPRFDDLTLKDLSDAWSYLMDNKEQFNKVESIDPGLGGLRVFKFGNELKIPIEKLAKLTADEIKFLKEVDPEIEKKQKDVLKTFYDIDDDTILKESAVAPEALEFNQASKMQEFWKASGFPAFAKYLAENHFNNINAINRSKHYMFNSLNNTKMSENFDKNIFREKWADIIDLDDEFKHVINPKNIRSYNLDTEAGQKMFINHVGMTMHALKETINEGMELDDSGRVKRNAADTEAFMTNLLKSAAVIVLNNKGGASYNQTKNAFIIDTVGANAGKITLHSRGTWDFNRMMLETKAENLDGKLILSPKTGTYERFSVPEFGMRRINEGEGKILQKHIWETEYLALKSRLKDQRELDKFNKEGLTAKILEMPRTREATVERIRPLAIESGMSDQAFNRLYTSIYDVQEQFLDTSMKKVLIDRKIRDDVELSKSKHLKTIIDIFEFGVMEEDRTTYQSVTDSAPFSVMPTKEGQEFNYVLQDSKGTIKTKIESKVMSIVDRLMDEGKSDLKTFQEELSKEFDGDIIVAQKYTDDPTKDITVLPPDSNELKAFYSELYERAIVGNIIKARGQNTEASVIAKMLDDSKDFKKQTLKLLDAKQYEEHKGIDSETVFGKPFQIGVADKDGNMRDYESRVLFTKEELDNLKILTTKEVDIRKELIARLDDPFLNVAFENGVITEKWSGWFDSLKRVINAKTDNGFDQELIDILKAGNITGYNIEKYDMDMFKQLVPDMKWNAKQDLDVLSVLKNLGLDVGDTLQLEAIARRFGVEIEEGRAHTASYDAWLVKQLIPKLSEHLEKNNVSKINNKLYNYIDGVSKKTKVPAAQIRDMILDYKKTLHAAKDADGKPVVKETHKYRAQEPSFTKMINRFLDLERKDTHSRIIKDINNLVDKVTPEVLRENIKRGGHRHYTNMFNYLASLDKAMFEGKNPIITDILKQVFVSPMSFGKDQWNDLTDPTKYMDFTKLSEVLKKKGINKTPEQISKEYSKAPNLTDTQVEELLEKVGIENVNIENFKESFINGNVNYLLTRSSEAITGATKDLGLSKEITNELFNRTISLYDKTSDDEGYTTGVHAVDNLTKELKDVIQGRLNSLKLKANYELWTEADTKKIFSDGEIERADDLAYNEIQLPSDVMKQLDLKEITDEFGKKHKVVLLTIDPAVIAGGSAVVLKVREGKKGSGVRAHPGMAVSLQRDFDGDFIRLIANGDEKMAQFMYDIHEVNNAMYTRLESQHKALDRFIGTDYKNNFKDPDVDMIYKTIEKVSQEDWQKAHKENILRINGEETIEGRRVAIEKAKQDPIYKMGDDNLFEEYTQVIDSHARVYDKNPFSHITKTDLKNRNLNILLSKVTKNNHDSITQHVGYLNKMHTVFNDAIDKPLAQMYRKSLSLSDIEKSNLKMAYHKAIEQGTFKDLEEIIGRGYGEHFDKFSEANSIKEDIANKTFDGLEDFINIYQRGMQSYDENLKNDEYYNKKIIDSYKKYIDDNEDTLLNREITSLGNAIKDLIEVGAHTNPDFLATKTANPGFAVQFLKHAMNMYEDRYDKLTGETIKQVPSTYTKNLEKPAKVLYIDMQKYGFTEDKMFMAKSFFKKRHLFRGHYDVVDETWATNQIKNRGDITSYVNEAGETVKLPDTRGSVDVFKKNGNYYINYAEADQSTMYKTAGIKTLGMVAPKGSELETLLAESKADIIRDIRILDKKKAQVTNIKFKGVSDKGLMTTEPTMFTVGDQTYRQKELYGLSTNNFMQSFTEGLEGLLIGKHFFKVNADGDGLIKDNRDFVKMVEDIRDLTTRPSGSTSNAIAEYDLYKLLYLSDLHKKIYGKYPENGEPENLMNLQGLGTRTGAGYVDKLLKTVTQDKNLPDLITEHYGKDSKVHNLFSPKLNKDIKYTEVGQEGIDEAPASISKGTKGVHKTPGDLKMGPHFEDDATPRAFLPKTSLLENFLGVKMYGNYKRDTVTNKLPSNSVDKGSMRSNFIAHVDRSQDSKVSDKTGLMGEDPKAGTEASVNALIKNTNLSGPKKGLPVGEPDSFKRTRTDTLNYGDYQGRENKEAMFAGYGKLKGQLGLYALVKDDGAWSRDDLGIDRHFRPETDEYMDNFKATTQVLGAEITDDGLNFKYDTKSTEPGKVETLLSDMQKAKFSARLFDDFDAKQLENFFIPDEIPAILRTPGENLYQKVSAYLKDNPLDDPNTILYKTRADIWKRQMGISDKIQVNGETRHGVFRGNKNLLENNVKHNLALLTSAGIDENSEVGIRAGRVITMAEDSGNKTMDRPINLLIKTQMLVQSLGKEGEADFVKYMKASYVESQRKGGQPLDDKSKAIMNSLGFKTFDEMKTWAKDFDAKHRDLTSTYITYTKEMIAHAKELQRIQGEDFNSFLLIAPFKGAKEKSKTKAAHTIKKGFTMWNKPEDLLFDHTLDSFFESSKSILSNIKKGYISEGYKAGLRNEGLLDNERVLNALLVGEEEFEKLIKEHVKDLSLEDSKMIKEQFDQIASLIKTGDKSALLQARHSSVVTKETLTQVYKTVMLEIDSLSRYSDLSEGDMRRNLSDPKLGLSALEKAEAERALDLKEQLAGLVGDVAKENPAFAEALYTKLTAEIAAAGPKAGMVDEYSRPITENGAFGRLRADSTEFLKQELKYKGENELLFKVNVIRDALKGNVYVGNSDLGKILNEKIYTKQSNDLIMKLRKGGKFTQGLIMMNLLKLPIRMFGFSAFDIAMISTVDPKSVLKIPTVIKSLKAYYQSEGKYSDENLDSYFAQKGFDSLTAKQRDVIVGEADSFANMSPLAAPYRWAKDLSRYSLDIQADFGRYALYLSLKERFEDPSKTQYYGPTYFNKELVDNFRDITEDEARGYNFRNKKGELVMPKASDRKAYYVVEHLLGSPGNFPKVAKELSGLLVFNTFPLAITRATKGYTSSTLKAVSDSFKGDPRGLFNNTAPLGLGLAGTWLVYELIMNMIESIYDMEEDDVEDIKSKMLTPDPFGTIFHGTPTFNYNSFHPVKVMDEMVTRPIRDAMEQEDKDIPKSVDALIRMLNSNAISRANPFLKIPVEVAAKKDLFGSDIIDTKYSYNMFENTVRKVMGIPLGIGMSRALVEGYQLNKYNDNTSMQNILSSIEQGIKNEVNGSRAYNKSKSNYYKSRGMISNYNAMMREENDTSWEASDLYSGEITSNRYNSTYDEVEYKKASAVLNKLIRQEKPMSEIEAAILDLIDPYGKHKLSPDNVQSALNTQSLKGRLENLKDPDAFLATLSDTERRQLEEGIKWEEDNYPLLSSISMGGNKPYERTPYLNKHYAGYQSRYSGSTRAPYINRGYYRSPYRDLERGHYNQVKVTGPSDKMGIWEK